MTATLGAAVYLQIQVLFRVQRASSSPLSVLSANQRFCMSDRGEFWHKLNYLATAWPAASPATCSNAVDLAWRNLHGQWRARRGDHSLDPHRAGLAHIMDVNERAGRAVAFYFIPENPDPRLDNRVSLDDPRLRALREIHARGHEIGIHPGYQTYRHPEALARSVATLRRVLAEEGIDQPRLGGRQHFLRWETPTTARLWDDQGLDYDSTLSFADRPGFRCGTCREYPLYDLHQRRPLRLREPPLIVMECSVIAERYLGLGYSDQALALMQGYRDTCHRFGGDFTLL